MNSVNLTLSAAQRIDAACDRFETEWHAGRHPRIDAYVSAAPESDRQDLRQQLLSLELELQGKGDAETFVTRSSVRSADASDRTVQHVSSDRPTHIGRFEIRAILGDGAFGRVFRAFDPPLNRDVAIKVPLGTTMQSVTERERFLKEARTVLMT